MTDAEHDLPEGNEAPPEPMGPLARITGVIFSPGKTFAYLNRKPDWLIPLIVVIIMGIAVQALYISKADLGAITRTQTESSIFGGMITEEQLDEIERQAAERSFTSAMLQTGIGVVVGTPIFFLALAGIFMLATKLADGKPKFKKVFSVVCYAPMIQIPYSLIAAVILATRSDRIEEPFQSVVKSSIGALMNPETTSKPLLSLMSSLDIFTIWYLVILTIGFSLTTRLSTKGAGVVVFGLWAVYVAGKTALGGILG